MLTTYYWDPPPGTTSFTWDTVSAYWTTTPSTPGNRTTWQNSNGSNQNTASIQAGSALAITISGSISPAAIDFLVGGPYTISGGTLLLQSTLTLDTSQGATAEIDSTISGSNIELVVPDTGSLTLTGNVTAAGITECTAHSR